MISRINYIQKELKNLVISDDKSNISDFFVADIHGGRSFLLNDGGFPLNDIDMILRQQDASIRDSLIKNLEEVPTSGVPADTPPDEVLLSLRSRYQQTPSEMISWYEKQLEIADAKKLAEKPAESSEKISFNEQSEVVDKV